MGTFGSHSAEEIMAKWRVTWLHKQQVWLQGTWSVKTRQKMTAIQRKGTR